MGEKQNKPKTGSSKPKISKKKAVVLSGDSITQRKKRNIPVTVEECISSEKKYILDRVRGRQPKLSYTFISYISFTQSAKWAVSKAEQPFEPATHQTEGGFSNSSF